jgi:hypothetical protein
MAMEEVWATPSQLRKGLPLAKQTHSDHLKLLRQMSIVKCKVHEGHIMYAINEDLINTFVGLFALASQAELKYDDNYEAEINIVGVRRKIGTTPY